MKILFWNTNKNPDINQYIESLVMDYDVDILVIAEYYSAEKELSELLKMSKQKLEQCNTLGCNRIKVWSNYVDVEASIQGSYHSIQIVDNKFVICCVHLFTDLHGNRSDERLETIRQIMHDINEVEEKIGSQQTIIIGDFNEMPYGKGCLNANGFHGLPALSIDDKSIRIVNGMEYRKFYNPMWNLLGDFLYPPGTYYLNQARLNNPMWFMLDQVIISKDVVPMLNREGLKIITTCSYGDLMDEKQRPNKSISDHFPIICEILDRQKEDYYG